MHAARPRRLTPDPGPPPGRPRTGAPLAIIAGGGRLPGLLAEAALADRRRVLVVGLEGEIDCALPEGCESALVRRGALGRLLKLLRGFGASEVVLAGAIRQRRMPRLSECDLAGLFALIRHRKLLAGGDDSVLRRVARLLEAHGLSIIGAHEVAPGLLAPEGPLGRHRPSTSAVLDIAVGAAAARVLGRRDAGQGVIALDGEVIARERVEGTDFMLESVARAGGAGGRGVLVKCPKPQQDRRFDLPAIGPDTVRRAVRAGLAGIAVEAGGTLVLERARVAAEADAAELFVVGFPAAAGREEQP